MAEPSARELHRQVLERADRWSSLRLYWLVRNFSALLGLMYFRVKIHGKEHLRSRGPAILAPVHRSNLDVPLISAHCPQRLRSLAKANMFRGPVSRWISSSIGAFPVSRGRLDRAALESAQTLLRRGEKLLVFPEGRRGSGPEVGEMQNGCAYLATSTGTRVIPIGVAGTEEAMPPGARLPRLRRVVIEVGEPIDPPTPGADGGPGSARELRLALSARLRTELQRLLDEAAVAQAALQNRRRRRQS